MVLRSSETGGLPLPDMSSKIVRLWRQKGRETEEPSGDTDLSDIELAKSELCLHVLSLIKFFLLRRGGGDFKVV